MKSVLQASWYFTIAIGNLIVVIIAGNRIVENQVYEYIIFAGLLSLATVLFGFLAYFYKYEEDIKKEAETEGEIEKSELKAIKWPSRHHSIAPTDDQKVLN
jgi:hypothetical protein